MKKLLNVFVLTMTLNFLALLGGAAYLWQSGRLNKAKALQIKLILYPPPSTRPSAPAETEAGATTRPDSELDRLLAASGIRPAIDQNEFIRRSFDAQFLQLDRARRELEDLKRQVDLANAKLAQDRDALERDRKALIEQQQQSTRLASDQGFQDTLALYQSMPAKQVKAIFMTMDELAVTQYLEAMSPRDAAKIIKEFTSPQETAFIHKVMERMRQPLASTSPDK